MWAVMYQECYHLVVLKYKHNSVRLNPLLRWSHPVYDPELPFFYHILAHMTLSCLSVIKQLTRSSVSIVLLTFSVSQHLTPNVSLEIVVITAQQCT